MSNLSPEQMTARHGVAQGSPIVRGKCPACGWTTLFLGFNGYVTCSNLACPDPSAASDLLATAAATNPHQ